jgi:hypothetical protein
MNFLVDLLARRSLTAADVISIVVTNCPRLSPKGLRFDLRRAAPRAEAVLISNLKGLRRRAVACDVDRSGSARGMTS